MKIEYLAAGADNCPLIRLFQFTLDELERLAQFARDLADARRSEVALHEQSWVEPVRGCRFFWRFDHDDIAVKLPSAEASFVLALSCEGWLEVECKLGMLTPAAGNFNWLNTTGDVNVLVSWNGLW
jgi:hypothetical protein